MLGAYYDTAAPIRAPSSSSRSTSSRSTTTAPASITNERALIHHRDDPSHDYSLDADTPLPRRTLDDVRSQVAQELAIRAVTKAHTVDGVKTNVVYSDGTTTDFLRRIADFLVERLRLCASFLFIIADTTPGAEDSTESNALFILGSSSMLVHRGALLTSSKFVGRLTSSSSESPTFFAASIRALGSSSYDFAALDDILRKAAQSPIDPLLPPPNSRSIAQLLSDARAKLQRVTPRQAWDELSRGGESASGNSIGGGGGGVGLEAPTILVDIRPREQRERTGGVRGSLVIERNVLEWRLDPRSDARLAIADRYDLRVIVFCQEGYASSLAAYSLQELGLLNATDVIGGYEAWKLAGLPVDTESEYRRREERSLASRAGSVV